MAGDIHHVIADGERVELTPQKLTVLVHPGEMEIDAPNRVAITPETTLAYAKEVAASGEWEPTRQHPIFLKLWARVWGDLVMPPEDLAKGNLAVRHTVGMILMLVEAKAKNWPVFLKLPESYLHPKQQANMMSMILMIQAGNL